MFGTLLVFSISVDCYIAKVVGEADETPGINLPFSITLQVKSHVGAFVHMPPGI
jgi:hypothetical protein